MQRWFNAVRVALPGISAALAAAIATALPLGSYALAEGCISISAPGDNLASLVDSSPPGTCYLLENGNYHFGNVVPKDNMRFEGAERDGVVVDGHGFENAFSGRASNVVIRGFTLQNFDNSQATHLQEQAPIRGTTGLWQSQPGSMGSGWLIENMVIRDNVASGIFLGDNFTVRNNIISGNGVTGIGGDEIRGGLIEGNDISRNGAKEASGALVNGGGIKLTQVDGSSDRLIVRGNNVHDQNRGIWCDVDCNGVTIEQNTVVNHRSSGIFYEISRNAIIRGNSVTNSNTWVDWTGEWNTGAISVGESANVIIENNLVSGAESAITIRQTKRPASGETWLAQRITSGKYLNTTVREIVVRGNTVRSSGSVGASHSITGSGLMDYDSVLFTGNVYDGGTTGFWWNGVRQTSAQWFGSGRDGVTATPASKPAAPPATVATSETIRPAVSPSETASPLIDEIDEERSDVEIAPIPDIDFSVSPPLSVPDDGGGAGPDDELLDDLDAVPDRLAFAVASAEPVDRPPRGRRSGISGLLRVPPLWMVMAAFAAGSMVIVVGELARSAARRGRAAHR